jgi:RNA polymerase sigma factor (sigma-70 family)
MDGPRAGREDEPPLKLVPPEQDVAPTVVTPHQEAVLANIELKAIGLTRKALVDDFDADDIVQKTMFGMWQRLTADPRLWADEAEDERDRMQRRIGVCAIIKLRNYGQKMRDREPEEAIDVDSLPSTKGSPLDRMIRFDFIVALAWALNTLARQARRIWCLMNLDEFSVDEIATEVGVAPSSVSPSVYKSNIALRDLMRGQGYPWPPESDS